MGKANGRGQSRISATNDQDAVSVSLYHPLKNSRFNQPRKKRRMCQRKGRCEAGCTTLLHLVIPVDMESNTYFNWSIGTDVSSTYPMNETMSEDHCWTCWRWKCSNVLESVLIWKCSSHWVIWHFTCKQHEFFTFTSSCKDSFFL